MSGWRFVYDKDFASVYDKDFVERIDLMWDGEDMKLVTTTTEDVVLDIARVIELRKLLQVIERRAKKEGK